VVVEYEEKYRGGNWLIILGIVGLVVASIVGILIWRGILRW
jgi:hypothetical protein